MNDNNMEEYCYGTDSRFLIKQFVSRDGDTVYMVHDADWVLDSEVRKGHTSPVVAQFETPQEAEDWCDFVEEGKIYSVPHEANFEGWPELEERVKGWTKSRK
jgi:hypothetical protein